VLETYPAGKFYAFVAILVVAAALPAAAFVPPSGVYDTTATTSQVCTLGYARAHRRVPYRVRDRVYAAYGLPRGQRRGYVIDHLVPLELGGTNSPANLWPQARAVSHRKDRDENRLRAEICDGQLSLTDARAEILRIWRR